MIKDYYKLVDQFADLSEVSNKPVKCCCGRRTACKCCFTSLFGENKQMGEVLAKTFDGSHAWIKTDKGIKIDAMFFPATAEKFVKDNMKSDKFEFKKLPTFILCNPNAMVY